MNANRFVRLALTGAIAIFGASVGAHGGFDFGFCFKGFTPGMEDGESDLPSQFGGACTWLLLYNATLKH